MNDSTPFEPTDATPFEARIVAWVLGEASAFEAAELDRLCQERPELQIFRRRMQVLHGLLTEAESPQADDSWKLPEEKRKSLGEILGEEKVVPLEPEIESHARRGALWALIAIAACLLLAFLAIQFLPRDYETKMVIEVKPRTNAVTRLTEAGKDASSAGQMTPMFFATEFEKIKSRNSLGKVVDNLELTQKWNVDKETAVNLLKKNVLTENINGTDLISIRVRNADAETSKEICQEVGRAYKQYRMETETKQADQQLHALNKAIQDQEDKVEERRKVLAQIVRTKGIVYRGQDSIYNSNEVFEDQGAQSALDTYNKLQQDKLQLESQINSLLKYDNDQLLTYASGLDLPDNIVKNLYPKYEEKKRELETLKSSGLADNHPTVKTEEKQVDGMKRQLEEGAVNLRATLQAQLAMNTDRLKNVEIRKDNFREDAIKRGLGAQDYVDAKKDFESDQKQLQQMKLAQVEETIQNKIQPQSVEVHDEPTTSKRIAIPFFSSTSASSALANNSPHGGSFLAGGAGGGGAASVPATPAALPEVAMESRQRAKMPTMRGMIVDSRESAVDEPSSDMLEKSKATKSMGDSDLAANDAAAARPDPPSAPVPLSDIPLDKAKFAARRAQSGLAGERNVRAIQSSMAPNKSLDALVGSSESSNRGGQGTGTGMGGGLTQAKRQPNVGGGKKSEVRNGMDRTVSDGITTGAGAMTGGKAVDDMDQLAANKSQNYSRVRDELSEKGKNTNGVSSEPTDSPVASAAGQAVLRPSVVGGEPLGDEVAKKDQAEFKDKSDEKQIDRSVVSTPTAASKPHLASEVSPEISASDDPYSTFSLNISDVSFQVAKAALEKDQRPDPTDIKPEQFYNAVDYGDASPASNEPVAATIEESAHPIIPGRTLVRIALKTGSVGRAASQPLRLTLLVDQSGSMSREDRLTAMNTALKQLGILLTKNDHITVIGFSREAHLLADNLPGDQATKLEKLVNQTASEGGTNLETALKLAGQLAVRHLAANEQNRIVLFTDGAANLGNADPQRLAQQVTALRQQGVAVDIAGIGTDDLNDQLLSELARHGNGRYYVAGGDHADDLARQLAGAFRPAAENVKVQVHFNPQRVGQYKLIGFEKDRLTTADFRNDAVDAAELAADEAGVALYQVETLPQGHGEIGEVSVRFKDSNTGQMVERKWTVPYDSATPSFDRASPSMQLAGLSMLVAQKLQGGPLADAIDFKELTTPRANVKQFYTKSSRVAEMLWMIGKIE